MALTSPASCPPVGLPGLDPSWSRLITATDARGSERTWHVLDNGVSSPRLTVVCVHGNPTWSYIWRRFLDFAPSGIRVIAVDQLGMGYSERLGTTRRLADRIDDLGVVIDALDITSPIVIAAHDWGGPVSLGWAVRNVDRLAGVVLTNTAVHQPAGAAAPTLIRLARWRPLLRSVTERSTAFLRGTTGMTDLTRAEARAILAPYATADRRTAIRDFVADIPLEPGHPSMPALVEVAEGLQRLRDVPVLMLWGPGDPVFSDLYLRDLRERLPHADVHRYEGARHLVMEDAPQAVADALCWIESLESVPAHSRRPVAASAGGRMWSRLAARRDDPSVAIDEVGRRRVSWAQLAQRVESLAGGLAARGIRPGDRVALLIRPGVDLIACVYALWRIGAVIVVADSGLGVTGMRRALRGAAPRHVIGITQGLVLARTLRIAGLRLSVKDLDAIALVPGPPVEEPSREADAAVVFTSGATGPAKGVVYRHDQLEAQRDALEAHYALTPDDALVAAFAPWAVLGPALGIASAIPDMDVAAPRTLTAAAFADAVSAVSGTLAWAAPAAVTNVVATADQLSGDQRAALASLRLLLIAGAPVSPALLDRAQSLLPSATLRTPYGMTEALPIADATRVEIAETLEGARGVLVGRPLPGVDVAISPLSYDGTAESPLTTEPEVTGEIVVSAPYVKDRYDQLWSTQSRSTRDGDRHRTGDVGHLDADGRLWVEGRLVHVIATADGPVTPVAVELAAQRQPGVVSAACVGVGPVGAAQVVVVVTTQPPSRSGSVVVQDGIGVGGVRDAVREATGIEVAAVISAASLPVDIRHNSKIDRARLARWAEVVLSGGRAGRP